MRHADPALGGWIDGRKVALDDLRLSIEDPGVQGGLGLFETIAVSGGAPLDLDAHLARLVAGAARLALEPPSPVALREQALALAAAQSSQDAWLKIVLTAGGRSIVFGGARNSAEEGRSATAVLLPWRRNPHDPLAGLKTLSCGGNWAGLAEARRRGADEGLWQSRRGHVAEGCTSNVFVVQGERVFTPALWEGILPGIVRALALQAARALGLSVHEVKVRPERLARANEAFLTSSLRGVSPLLAVDGAPVGDGAPGRVTRRISEEVARLRQRP